MPDRKKTSGSDIDWNAIPEESTSGLDSNVLSKEISEKESHGDYAITNPNSSATGKYQFLWGEHGADIQKVTGVKSKSEFLSNPKAQEDYFKYHVQNNLAPGVEKLRSLNKQGYSDSQLAKLIHFKGLGGASEYLATGGDKTTAHNISIPEYIGQPEAAVNWDAIPDIADEAAQKKSPDASAAGSPTPSAPGQTSLPEPQNWNEPQATLSGESAPAGVNQGIDARTSAPINKVPQPSEKIKNSAGVLAADILNAVQGGKLPAEYRDRVDEVVNKASDPHGDPEFTGNLIKHRIEALESERKIKVNALGGAASAGINEDYLNRQRELISAAKEITGLQMANRALSRYKSAEVIPNMAGEEVPVVTSWDQPQAILTPDIATEGVGQGINPLSSAPINAKAAPAARTKEQFAKDKIAAEEVIKYDATKIGIEQAALLGDEDAKRDLVKYNTVGKIPDDRKVNYQLAGLNALQSGAMAAKESGNEEAAQELAKHSDNIQERLEKDNPGYFKKLWGNQVGNYIYDKIDNPLYGTVFSRPKLTEEEIKKYGKEAGLEPYQIAKLTPEDVPTAASAPGQFAQGAFNAILFKNENDAGGKFFTGEMPTNQQQGTGYKHIIGEMAGGAGTVAGFMGQSMLTGGILTELGVLGDAALNAAKYEKVSNLVPLAISNYNSAYQRSEQVIGDRPEDEAKRALYTAIDGTIATGLMSIDPSTALGKKAIGLGSEVEKIITSKSINEITKAELQPAVQKWLTKAAIVSGVTAEHAATQAFIMGANKTAENIVDMVMDPNHRYDVMDGVKEAAISGAVSMFLPSLFAGINAGKKQSSVNKVILHDIASNPEKFKTDLGEQLKEGKISQEDYNETVGNINKVEAIYKKQVPEESIVTGEPLTDQQKADYAANLVQDKALQAEAEKTTDKAQSSAINQKIKDLEAERSEILNESHEDDAESDIKLSDLIGKKIVLDGEVVTLHVDDANRVIATDKNGKEFDNIGNVLKVGDQSIKGLGIEVAPEEVSIVSASPSGKIQVRGKEYELPEQHADNPLGAINYRNEPGKKGVPVSVTLEQKQPNGSVKKVTFRGDVAEDIMYQLHLQKLDKDNDHAKLEEFINTDAEAVKKIENGRPAEVAEAAAVGDNGKVSEPEKKSGETTDELKKEIPLTPERVTAKTNENESIRNEEGGQSHSETNVNGQKSADSKEAGDRNGRNDQQEAGQLEPEKETELKAAPEGQPLGVRESRRKKLPIKQNAEPAKVEAKPEEAPKETSETTTPEREDVGVAAEEAPSVAEKSQEKPTELPKEERSVATKAKKKSKAPAQKEPTPEPLSEKAQQISNEIIGKYSADYGRNMSKQQARQESVNKRIAKLEEKLPTLKEGTKEYDKVQEELSGLRTAKAYIDAKPPKRSSLNQSKIGDNVTQRIKERDNVLEQPPATIEEWAMQVMLSMSDNKTEDKFKTTKELERNLSTRKGTEERANASQFHHREGKADIDTWANDVADDPSSWPESGLNLSDAREIKETMQQILSDFESKTDLKEHLEDIFARRAEDQRMAEENAWANAYAGVKEEDFAQYDEFGHPIQQKLDAIAETIDKAEITPEDEKKISDFYAKYYNEETGIVNYEKAHMSKEWDQLKESLSPAGQELIYNVIPWDSFEQQSETIQKLVKDAEQYESAKRNEPAGASPAKNEEPIQREGTPEGGSSERLPESKGAEEEGFQSAIEKTRKGGISEAELNDAIRKANDLRDKAKLLENKSDNESQVKRYDLKSQADKIQNEAVSRITPFEAVVDSPAEVGALKSKKYNESKCRELSKKHQKEYGGEYVEVKVANPDGSKVDHAVVVHQDYIYEPQTDALISKNAFNEYFDTDIPVGEKKPEAAVKPEPTPVEQVRSDIKDKTKEIEVKKEFIKQSQKNLNKALKDNASLEEQNKHRQNYAKYQKELEHLQGELDLLEERKEKLNKNEERETIFGKLADKIENQYEKNKEKNKDILLSNPLGLSTKIADHMADFVVARVVDGLRKLHNIDVAIHNAIRQAKEKYGEEAKDIKFEDLQAVKENLGLDTEVQKSEPTIHKDLKDWSNAAIEDISNGERYEDIAEDVLNDDGLTDKEKTQILNYISWQTSDRDIHNANLAEPSEKNNVVKDFAMTNGDQITTMLSGKTIEMRVGEKPLNEQDVIKFQLDLIAQDAQSMVSKMKHHFGTDVVDFAPEMIRQIDSIPAGETAKRVTALVGLMDEVRKDRSIYEYELTTLEDTPQDNARRQEIFKKLAEIPQILSKAERAYQETQREASKTLNAGRIMAKLFSGKFAHETNADNAILRESTRKQKESLENNLANTNIPDKIAEEGPIRTEKEANAEVEAAQEAIATTNTKPGKEKAESKTPTEKAKNIIKKVKDLATRKEAREKESIERMKQDAAENLKKKGMTPDNMFDKIKEMMKKVKC